jgi:DNA-binding SARP family transcriptional activator
MLLLKALGGLTLASGDGLVTGALTQRRRLARRLCGACVELATAAAAQGAPDRSAQWWRRAADIDPLDSQIAISVVEALAAMGNPAGAIRHAQLHRERLRDELGIAPDASLETLVARLSRRADSGSPPGTEAR